MPRTQTVGGLWLRESGPHHVAVECPCSNGAVWRVPYTDAAELAKAVGESFQCQCGRSAEFQQVATAMLGTMGGVEEAAAKAKDAFDKLGKGIGGMVRASPNIKRVVMPLMGATKIVTPLVEQWLLENGDFPLSPGVGALLSQMTTTKQ